MTGPRLQRRAHEGALGRLCYAMSMEISPIPPIIILRDLPGIAEVERIVSQPGAGWREDDPKRVALIDRVSVSLFGITQGDTERVPPAYDDFLTEDDRLALKHLALLGTGNRFRYAEAPYDQAVAEHDEWEANFDVLYDDADPDDGEFWRILGVDVTDGSGEDLHCLHNFSRQLIVSAKGLLPGALFTPDGSGKRGSPDAHAWGAALERAAQEFKARKR